MCAPGYRRRKHGEAVRTRTTVSQAYSYHWLGSFENRGNGHDREKLRKERASITCYLSTYQLLPEHTLLRLDGQYDTGAMLCDSRQRVQPPRSSARPGACTCHLISSSNARARSLRLSAGTAGVRWRTVPRHRGNTSGWQKKSPVGVTRVGVVYERFFTHLPQQAFTACDVVALDLQRGAIEPLLANEDQEIDPDRWCSHSAWGQEAWPVVGQWPRNLRLELGHQFYFSPLRIVQSQERSGHRCRATVHLPSRCRGRQSASPDKTSPSSLRECCCVLPSSAGKPMAVCACSNSARIRDCPLRTQCQ